MTFVVTLYRVTGATDVLANVGATEKIAFNSSKNTSIENAFLYADGLQIKNQEGLGDNSAPGQELGNQQALGSTEKLYVLKGFITKVNGTSDNGLNAFVDILQKWDDEAKQTNTWAEGRFGIDIGYLHKFDVIPTRAGGDFKGLIWLNLDLTSNLSTKVPRLEFEIRLRRSRGDGS